MNDNLYVVIMAGGIGSRFWPYSRNSKPKQFLDILNTGHTLLQLTYRRFTKIARKDNIYIVSNKQYEGLIKEQLPDIKDDQILSEPVRRNTAPCIAYASYKLNKINPDGIMVVTPADHAIFIEDEYLESIEVAANQAAKGDQLITLGITPNRPETGYGYIQYHDDADEVKRVKTFTEKPQLDLAKKFLESGDFVWNAGVFIWSIASVNKAFEQHYPELSEIFEKGYDAYGTDKEADFVAAAYGHCKNISIDYAIMEKATNVFVIVGDFGWSDLGSWNSVFDILPKDDHENVIDGQVIAIESEANIVKTPEEKLVLIQGLEGYLVGDFGDVLIVCKRDDSSRFREFFSEVKAQTGDKYV